RGSRPRVGGCITRDPEDRNLGISMVPRTGGTMTLLPVKIGLITAGLTGIGATVAAATHEFTLPVLPSPAPAALMGHTLIPSDRSDSAADAAVAAAPFRERRTPARPYD